MSLRVTESMIFRQGLSSLQRHAADLFVSQLHIASGRRILAPSDDPGGTARVLDIDHSIGELSRFADNSAEARGTLDRAAGELQGVLDLVAQARQLTVEGLNAPLAPEDRVSIANSIDAVLESILAIANAR